MHIHQFGCNNEAQFLCKALQALCKTLFFESSSIIKTTAVQIADLQNIKQSQYSIVKTTKSNDDNPITVYKYIHQQYIDQLSKLHSNIMDCLGSFLNKTQSIEF